MRNAGLEEAQAGIKIAGRNINNLRYADDTTLVAESEEELKTALTYSFPNLEPVHCSMSSSNYCFLTCIQISQEAGQVFWYSHFFKNFPQFVVIHTVKGFGIVNKVLFQWSNRCWQFDLWFFCLFSIQLEHLEIHGSCTVEAWLGEFYIEKLYKKDLHDPDNHDGVITHLEPDILECEVKWEASLWTKLVQVMAFQLSYFES